MRKTFLTVLILHFCIYSFGQLKKEPIAQSQLTGILFFEKGQGIYSMYFVKTSFKDLRSLLQKKDTLKLLAIGSPGNDASNIADFKNHLDKSICFDSLLATIIIDDKGLYIEDTCVVNYKHGIINYSKNKRYQLQKQYEKRKINNKLVIYEIAHFIPINSFISNKKKISKKLK